MNHLTIDISIVIPVFKEEGNIEMLYQELTKFLDVNLTWEILFVDDGSTDGSWKKIISLCGKDKRIRGIRFSRNFGHQSALVAGLSNARGNAVITMDADLQHPPEVIPKLLEEWRKGAKIVNTVRIDHETIPKIKKITSRLFYRVFSFLSGVEISEGMADYRLLDKKVVKELLKLNESGVFLRGLVQWIGFQNSEVEFQCRDRYSGETKYTFFKMLKFAWRGITSFSLIPLRIGIIIGVSTSALAFYQLMKALYLKWFTDKTVPGWTSTVGIISLLFGILFIIIGLLGEYIGRILIEVRGRPKYIISEIVESKMLNGDG